jgi:hypothetical protein
MSRHARLTGIDPGSWQVCDPTAPQALLTWSGAGFLWRTPGGAGRGRAGQNRRVPVAG